MQKRMNKTEYHFAIALAVSRIVSKVNNDEIIRTDYKGNPRRDRNW
ncbi:hypothetical protein [Methanobrevibacter sp.]|nr:hypothetical protein [Methanobrevibacter sp.]MDO5860907.1 hypothetical protein [Methanobrevibacter sp.]